MNDVHRIVITASELDFLFRYFDVNVTDLRPIKSNR